MPEIEGVQSVCDDILKSPNDKDRQYRSITLNNELRVMLISDPETQMSAASMNVGIGYLSDPKEIPGLAHFLEHMLFMGTEKYPEENEYTKFICDHAGETNAYTTGEHMCFYFTVAPDQLHESLDRFSQSFISPLLSESAAEREVQAVDEEHRKNIKVDAWRKMQLMKSLVSKDHPYSKFGTGTAATLNTIPKNLGIDVRSKLLEFHKKWFSANLMTLAINGKESIETLTSYAVQMFGPIVNKNVQRPPALQNPFTSDLLKQEVHLVPIADIRQLTVTFNIPFMTPLYRSGPDHYVSHLIGHESEGSLLSALKEKNWVNELFGGAAAGARAFDFFSISMLLTEEGEDHIYDIITLIFQYIAMLKEKGPEKWVFDECKKVSEMLFRFKEKGQPASLVDGISNSLHFPDANGKRQSPVELVGEAGGESVLKQFPGPLHCSYASCPAKIWNNGRTFKVAPLDEEMYLYGGPLNLRYNLDHFHLHWNNSRGGSEHTVGGNKYPAELHMIHKVLPNQELPRRAIGFNPTEEQFCVLALFVTCDAPKDHLGFSQLVNNLHLAHSVCCPKKIQEDFDFSSLLPHLRDRLNYWTYTGSLTTPPCSETVRFIVFHKPLSISQKQFAALAELKDEMGKPITNNCRPIQPLNGRTVASTCEYSSADILRNN